MGRLEDRARLAPARGGFVTGTLFFLLVVAALVVLAWVLVLPRVISGSVTRLTGCDTTITQLHANPFSGKFDATGVRLDNPAGWGEDALVEIPRLTGRVALGSLADRTVVLEAARVDIARLLVVVDAEGKTNFEALGPRTAAVTPGDDDALRHAAAGLPSIGDGPAGVLIRRLDLRIQRIELVDLGTSPARVLTDELNYEHTYENISRYQQLLTPALMTRLAKSPALWQVLINNGLLGGVEGAPGGMEQLWNRARGAVNSFLQGLEQTEKP